MFLLLNPPKNPTNPVIEGSTRLAVGIRERKSTIPGTVDVDKFPLEGVPRGPVEVPHPRAGLLSFASTGDGTLDGTRQVVSYPIATSVRKEAERLFAADQVAVVLAALESTALPLSSDDPERIHLAILLLSNGDWPRFDRELREAAKDWRDTLCAAGLENADWRSVLWRRGIDVKS